MIARGAALVAVLVVLVPGAGVAQVSLFAGGSAVVPVADFGDVADTGYRAVVGGTLGLGDGGPVLGLTGYWGKNPHEIAGDRSELYGLVALAGYGFHPGARLRLTPWAGLGGTVHARESDTLPGLDARQSGLTLHAGLTLSRPVGRVGVFAFVFYERGLGDLGTERYPTEAVIIGAGIEVPLGQ